MNLNQLWSGNDYAYYDMRGRGEQYRPGAQRVRVIRAYQKRVYMNERMSGFAEVQFLTDDGEPILNYKSEPRIVEVRARDIAMRWEAYIDERDHREAERERLIQERAEEQAREQTAKTALVDAMAEKFGISRNLITSVDEYSVRINRPGLERELGLT